MRSREKWTLCIGEFDGSNFACLYACSCKTECEAQTPEAIKTSEEVVEEIAEIEEVAEEEIVGAEAIEPEDVVQEPIDNVEGTAPDKQCVPSSRFDIIDISEKEKE